MARVAAAVAMLPVVLGGGSLRATTDTLHVARNVSRPPFFHFVRLQSQYVVQFHMYDTRYLVPGIV